MSKMAGERGVAYAMEGFVTASHKKGKDSYTRGKIDSEEVVGH